MKRIGLTLMTFPLFCNNPGIHSELHTLDNQNRLTLLEIIEDRHGKESVLITSQVPVSRWYDIIGEKTVADAILDRLIHDAHRIELKGESLRKTRKRTSDKPFNMPD